MSPVRVEEGNTYRITYIYFNFKVLWPLSCNATLWYACGLGRILPCSGFLSLTSPDPWPLIPDPWPLECTVICAVMHNFLCIQWRGLGKPVKRY